MVPMLWRSTPADDEDECEAERPRLLRRIGNWITGNPRDAVALLAAVVATGVIAVNALLLQVGPHPAPLFALRRMPPDSVPAVPRARPAVFETVRDVPTQRTRAELVTEIQRGLAKRGLYDGPIDGIYGPKTDAAVRDFAQSAQIKVGPEPNEALLQSILGQAGKPSQMAAMPRPRRDPIADLIGPSSRILAVQRALSDFGYGQIKPTGVLGPDTAAAIEKFERARHLPITGQMSERLIRELAAVTGRPLE
jgi:peptidoglycan hydrolase-like protein with peptidoglycan-binding domain